MTATILAVVLPVISALVTFVLTRAWTRADEKRTLKREHLTRLMAHRYDLRGDEFSAALNGAVVVFADSKRVMPGLLRFHAAVVSQGARDVDEAQRALLDMIWDMWDDLGIPRDAFDDHFLLTPFNTRQSSQLAGELEG